MVSFKSLYHLFCRNDPPGQNTSLATQELLRLVEANPSGLGTLDPINDLKLRDMELVEQFQTLKQLEDGFQHFKCVHDPSFLDNVRIYYLVIEDFKKENSDTGDWNVFILKYMAQKEHDYQIKEKF